MRGTSGNRRRIAWCAVAASATLAGGFLVADAAQSTTAGADSVAAIEHIPVTSTSRPVTAPRTPSSTTVATTPPGATTTQPAATTTVATTPPAATTTTIELAVPVTAAAETSVAPAITEQVTEVVDVDATVPVPTNQSSCRNDLPGAVMTIEMPDISYSCSVYAGGQSVIDAGAVTMISSQYSSLPLAAHPGGAGTLWITGHRVTHGGPFSAVPDLADGAIVTVSDGNGTASYVIVGRSYVEVRDGYAVDASGQTTESATLDAVLRSDRNAGLAPRLLLQTCDAENFRWMIYADLIAS